MIVSWEIKSKQRTKSQIVNLFIDIGKKRKKLLSTIRERRLAHCHFFFFLALFPFLLRYTLRSHFPSVLIVRFFQIFSIGPSLMISTLYDLQQVIHLCFFFFFLRSGNNLSDEYGHQIERKIPQYRWRCENVSRRGAHILIGRRN